MAAGPPRALRVLNDQAALGFILEAGVVSRAELVRLTGLSKPGVAELLSRLEQAGLIEQAGTRPGGPGPNARTWRVRPGVGCSAAVDVTAAGWSLRIVDIDGSRVAEADGRWSGTPTPSDVVGAVTGALADAGVRRSRLLGAAVAVPGAVDPRTGIVRGAPELPGLVGVDLAGALGEGLGVPVAVENDVNLMALAAVEAGAVTSAAFVWIDEGLGSAAVRHEELLRGFRGGAGEIDYLPVPAAPGSPVLEKLGDLLSPEGLDRLAGAAGAEVALAAATSTDPFGREIVRRLALGLVAVATVLDPEVILLGGRFGAGIAERLGDALRVELARLLETEPFFVAEVRPSMAEEATALGGAEHVALQAARRHAFRSGSLVGDASGREYPS